MHSDIRDLFGQIPQSFNQEAAEGIDAVFQFDITGNGGGNWSITIADKTCAVKEGKHSQPTVTLTMSTETWLGIINREIIPFEAFMKGVLKVSGDMMMAQRVPELFNL